MSLVAPLSEALLLNPIDQPTRLTGQQGTHPYSIMFSYRRVMEYEHADDFAKRPKREVWGGSDA